MNVMVVDRYLSIKLNMYKKIIVSYGTNKV